MANSGDYGLCDAMILASEVCERCMNALGHQYRLPWGYADTSEQYLSSRTRCKACDDQPLAQVPSGSLATAMKGDGDANQGS
jgi:hypothetical protein